MKKICSLILPFLTQSINYSWPTITMLKILISQKEAQLGIKLSKDLQDWNFTINSLKNCLSKKFKIDNSSKKFALELLISI